MSAYFKVFSTIAKKLKGNKSKVPSTITSVKPKVGSLTRRRKDQDDVIKSADKAIRKRNLTKEQGVAVKKTIAPGLKKISKTQDDIDRLEKKLSAKGKEKLREKKMGGGMMGRRKFGSGTKFGSADGVITPYEKRRGQAIEAAIKARKGQRKSPSLKEMTKPKKIKSPMEDPMRDRMKQPLKRKKP